MLHSKAGIVVAKIGSILQAQKSPLDHGAYVEALSGLHMGLSVYLVSLWRALHQPLRQSSVPAFVSVLQRVESCSLFCFLSLRKVSVDSHFTAWPNKFLQLSPQELTRKQDSQGVVACAKAWNQISALRPGLNSFSSALLEASLQAGLIGLGGVCTVSSFFPASFTVSFHFLYTESGPYGLL